MLIWLQGRILTQASLHLYPVATLPWSLAWTMSGWSFRSVAALRKVSCEPQQGATLEQHEGAVVSTASCVRKVFCVSNTCLFAALGCCLLLLQDGQLVTFSEVVGMTELNSQKPVKIKNCKVPANLKSA